MIFGLVVALHVLISLFLIGVILLQGGRGSLGEALGGAAAQSLFGGGANAMMTKLTAICASLFMVTCLALAALSATREQSVVDRMPTSLPEIPLLPSGEQGPLGEAPPVSTAPPSEAKPSTPTPRPVTIPAAPTPSSDQAAPQGPPQ